MPRFSRIEVEEILAQAKKLGKERFEDTIAPNQPQQPTISVHAQMVVVVCKQNAVKATDLEGFTVWRNTVDTSQTAEQVGWVDCSPSQEFAVFPDTSVAESTTYYYWVKAKDIAGNSSSFSPASAPIYVPAASGDESNPPEQATDIVLTSVAWVQLDGTLISRITGTFTAGTRTQYTEIYYAEGATPEDTDFRLINMTASGGFSITGLKPSTAYTIRVVCRNPGGSAPAVDVTHTTASKDTSPAAPTTFAAVQEPQNRAILNLTWDRVDEPDIRGYKVRRGGTEWANATQAVAGTPEPITPDNRLSMTLTESSIETWRVKAVDRAGNESEEATVVVNAQVEPEDVAGLTAVQDPANRTQLKISWTPSTQLDVKRYAIRIRGSSWETATIPDGCDKIANTYVTITLDAEGPLTIRAKIVT